MDPAQTQTVNLKTTATTPRLINPATNSRSDPTLLSSKNIGTEDIDHWIIIE